MVICFVGSLRLAESSCSINLTTTVILEVGLQWFHLRGDAQFAVTFLGTVGQEDVDKRLEFIVDMWRRHRSL